MLISSSLAIQILGQSCEICCQSKFCIDFSQNNRLWVIYTALIWWLGINWIIQNQQKIWLRHKWSSDTLQKSQRLYSRPPSFRQNDFWGRRIGSLIFGSRIHHWNALALILISGNIEPSNINFNLSASKSKIKKLTFSLKLDFNLIRLKLKCQFRGAGGQCDQIRVPLVYGGLNFFNSVTL